LTDCQYISLLLQQVFGGAVLIVGRRADITVQDRELYRPESVHREVSNMRHRLHSAYGIDYFAIARNHYPWHLVPDLVVGRPKYDNFLIEIASMSNVTVVDATRTLTALHQTDVDGVGAGLGPRIDSSYNIDVISPLQPRRACSHIKCSTFVTRWRSTSAVNDFVISPETRRVYVERRKNKTTVSPDGSRQ